MRALILGAGGMLGQALTRHLAAQNIAATALTRSQCDVTSVTSVDSAIAHANPTHIFNCAAYTAVDLAQTSEPAARLLNTDAPAILGRSASRHGAVAVHFSTDFVFDGNSTRPYRESDATHPTSIYGQTKLAGETALLSAGHTHLVVRTAWLFGRPGKNFVRTMVTRGKAGQPLRVVADQHGCPTLTDDLAAATLVLAKAGASGVYHLTGSTATTWFNFAQASLKAFDIDAKVDPITTADWQRQYPTTAPRPASSVLDCSKAKSLGAACPGYEDALARYAAQVTAHGFDAAPATAA